MSSLLHKLTLYVMEQAKVNRTAVIDKTLWYLTLLWSTMPVLFWSPDSLWWKISKPRTGLTGQGHVSVVYYKQELYSYRNLKTIGLNKEEKKLNVYIKTNNLISRIFVCIVYNVQNKTKKIKEHAREKSNCSIKMFIKSRTIISKEPTSINQSASAHLSYNHTRIFKLLLRLHQRAVGGKKEETVICPLIHTLESIAVIDRGENMPNLQPTEHVQFIYLGFNLW